MALVPCDFLDMACVKRSCAFFSRILCTQILWNPDKFLVQRFCEFLSSILAWRSCKLPETRPFQRDFAGSPKLLNRSLVLSCTSTEILQIPLQELFAQICWVRCSIEFVWTNPCAKRPCNFLERLLAQRLWVQFLYRAFVHRCTQILWSPWQDPQTWWVLLKHPCGESVLLQSWFQGSLYGDLVNFHDFPAKLVDRLCEFLQRFLFWDPLEVLSPTQDQSFDPCIGILRVLVQRSWWVPLVSPNYFHHTCLGPLAGAIRWCFFACGCACANSLACHAVPAVAHTCNTSTF